jgi:DNA-binding phage protein
MSEISREQLHAYLDDALSDAETAKIEHALRNSEPLRRALRQAMQERDRGEHSLGAIWRRERLTCPTREQLGSYLLQVLEEEQQDYFAFHLRVIACPYCTANLADLQARQQEAPPQTRERRRRFFQSSAGYLYVGRDTKKDKTRRK